jgi:hypothetical protein
VPSVFVHHDTGDQAFGWNAVLDQALRRWRLDDRALACPAAVLGAVGHDHLVLGRNPVETLRAVLSDDMHLTMAAGAKRALGFDRDMHAGEMRRQRATIDPPLVVLVGQLVGRAVLLLLVVIVTIGERGLDIFQRQLHLIAIKPFGPPAELRALKLPQQMAQLVVLVRQLAALRNGDIALARQLAYQRPQDIDVVRKSIDRHAKTESDSRSVVAHEVAV